MNSSQPPSRLTPLQRELLAAFSEREERFFLTGGGALAGFYFGHRDTEDLDFFSPPGPDLDDAARALGAATLACGATMESVGRSYPDFRRYLASRGSERCVVDLVIDRAPMVDKEKTLFGAVRVDTLREIAANKISALHSRNEIKDLVDLRELVRVGIDLEQAFADAETKDAGADPATLAWVLDQLALTPDAILPGGVAAFDLVAFRDQLVPTLRAMAFRRTRRS